MDLVVFLVSMVMLMLLVVCCFLFLSYLAIYWFSTPNLHLPISSNNNHLCKSINRLIDLIDFDEWAQSTIVRFIMICMVFHFHSLFQFSFSISVLLLLLLLLFTSIIPSIDWAIRWIWCCFVQQSIDRSICLLICRSLRLYISFDLKYSLQHFHWWFFHQFVN